MPPLHRTRGQTPRKLPAAPVSIVWSPLPAGSPRVAGNFPGDYWPGRRFVDWVGTDLYSAYPVWHQLNRFFGQRRYAACPSRSPSGPWRRRRPRFARRIFAWAKRRPRVRMLIYYRGFGEDGNPYRLGLYPRTASVIRRQLRRKRFPAFAPQHAQLPGSADKRWAHGRPPFETRRQYDDRCRRTPIGPPDGPTGPPGRAAAARSGGGPIALADRGRLEAPERERPGARPGPLEVASLRRHSPVGRSVARPRRELATSSRPCRAWPGRRRRPSRAARRRSPRW